MSREVLERLRGADPGARWRRVALQVNPFSYREAHLRAGRAGKYADEGAYNQALVAALAATVDAIGITGHLGDTPDARSLGRLAVEAGVTVFPGVEVECDGVHVLCLFDADAGFDAVAAFQHWYTGDSAEHGCALASLLEQAGKHHCMMVPAHVQAAKGLLCEMSGKQLANVLASEHLHVMATYQPAESMDPGHQEYLQAANAGRDAPLGLLAANDVSDPQDVGKSNSTSWLRLSELSLDGLSCAFSDPASRVLAHGAVPLRRPGVRALTWEGGFLDGITVGFSDALTVLIGGRGAGKSTIVESIRFVIGGQPSTEIARKRHEQVIAGALREGTRVTMLYADASGEDGIVSRTVGSAPIWLDANGLVTASPSKPPRIEVYAQHELSDLSEGQEGRLQLLSRFVDPRPDVEEAVRRTQEELRSLTERLIKARRLEAELAEEVAAIPELEARLERLRESGIHDVAERHAAVDGESALFDQASQRIANLGEAIDSLEQARLAGDGLLRTALEDGTPSADLVARLADALNELDTCVVGNAKVIRSAAGKAKSVVDATVTAWATRRAEAKEAYQLLLRELAEPAGAQAFVSIQAELDRLRGRSLLLFTARDEGARTTEERTRAIGAFRDAQENRLTYYRAARDRAAAAVGDQLRVSVNPSGDRAELRQALDRLGGRTSEAKAALCDPDRPISILGQVEAPGPGAGIEVPGLVTTARRSAEALSAAFGLPSAQAARIAGAGDATLDRWEAIDLRPTVKLSLKVGKDGATPVYREVGTSLSIGQNATALLRLLLSGGIGTLVVDQPEDDLDNRFVHSQVVSDLRREKHVRQIIASSHNANIPVLGDAEQIVVLEPDPEGPGSGNVRTVGSLDRLAVREAAAEILEGGAEALRRRFRRYHLSEP